MAAAGETSGKALRRILRRAVARALIAVIRLYQYCLSPFVGRQCRFYPTCSHYAVEAIDCHGPWRGSWLTVKRVCRCHPWAQGGIDPVPGTHSCSSHRSC